MTRMGDGFERRWAVQLRVQFFCNRISIPDDKACVKKSYKPHPIRDSVRPGYIGEQSKAITRMNYASDAESRAVTISSSDTLNSGVIGERERTP